MIFRTTKYDIWTIYILVFQQTNTTFSFFDIQTTMKTTRKQKTIYCMNCHIYCTVYLYSIKYSATTYYYIPLHLYLFPPYLSSFTSNVDSNPFYFFPLSLCPSYLDSSPDHPILSPVHSLAVLASSAQCPTVSCPLVGLPTKPLP